MLREKCLWKAELPKGGSLKALSGKHNHKAKLHVRPSRCRRKPASHVEGSREAGRKNGKQQLWQTQPINFTRQLWNQEESCWQLIFLQSLSSIGRPGLASWWLVVEGPLRSRACFILAVPDENVSPWLTTQNRQEASKLGSSCWPAPLPSLAKIEWWGNVWNSGTSPAWVAAITNRIFHLKH